MQVGHVIMAGCWKCHALLLQEGRQGDRKNCAQLPKSCQFAADLQNLGDSPEKLAAAIQGYRGLGGKTTFLEVAVKATTRGWIDGDDSQST